GPVVPPGGTPPGLASSSPPPQAPRSGTELVTRRDCTMGLTIKTPAEFQLEMAADRSVSLPAIALVPTPENLPHIKKFEVEVVGRASPLHRDDEVDPIPPKLVFGYAKLESRPGKEVALRQQMTVPVNRVVLDGPIPPGARFTLTAQAWYCDSDAQGRPSTAAGVKGPVKASTVLVP